MIAAGLCTRIRSIHCQEIFDYSTYNQPHAVKVLCGFGGSMDDIPMMLLPSIPTMVWGGNLRLIGRGLGMEIDEITEEVERVALESSVDTVMGPFDKGTQGAFWLKVIGKVKGRERIVIDHITRLARHVGNAVLREDARGARLAKERKDSPRRIDAAVAASNGGVRR